MSPEQTLQLRVRSVGVAVYPPGARFGPRTSADFEFVWVIEGGGTIYFDQNEIQVGPGSILLCRPGMVDRYEWSPKARTIHAFTHFELEHRDDRAALMDQWPLHQQMPKNDLLRPLFRYVISLNT